MSAVFDTLRFVQGAKENGFTQQQAEYQATQLYNLFTNYTATKQDIDLLRRDLLIAIKSSESEIKNDIKSLEHNFVTLEHKIISLETRLFLRLGGLMVTCIGVLGFILKH